MTRSVKDLRELINVSRLSYRDDDEEEELYHSSSPESLQDFGDIPLEVSQPALPKRRNKDLEPLPMKGKPESPPLSPGSSDRGSPLPPIGASSSAISSPPSSGRNSPTVRSQNANDYGARRKDTKRQKPNFDSVLLYMDATVVSDWLTRANTSIQQLTSWLHFSDNFIQFAQFWLSEMPRSKQRELIEMEFTISMEEIKFAFGAGLDGGSVSSQDIDAFARSVFWEYPEKFHNSETKDFFLKILLCLCSGKKNTYRALLSDVQCSTSNKQYVQLILATRAFAVVNICSGVLEFYKQAFNRSSYKDLKENFLVSKTLTTIATEFAFQAVRKNLPDVLGYLLQNYGLQHNTLKDSSGKSLVFVSVLSSKENILSYLLKLNPRVDINEKAPSGNTPLHAAVNTGNITLVKVLINAGADVNAWNPECEGATPLHLAIMSGNAEMVSVMLEAKCDLGVKMGIPATVTPMSLAEDLGLDDIVELLSKFTVSR